MVQRMPAGIHVPHPELEVAAIRFPARLSRRTAPCVSRIVGLRLRVLPLTSQKHLSSAGGRLGFPSPLLLKGLYRRCTRWPADTFPTIPIVFAAPTFFRSLVVRQPSPDSILWTNFQGNVSKPPGVTLFAPRTAQYSPSGVTRLTTICEFLPYVQERRGSPPGLCTSRNRSA